MAQNNQEEELQTIRGVQFPSARYSSRKTIEEILDYIPHDGDIIVASYPKTGSTWLQYIVLQIVSNGKCYPSFDDVLYKMSPLMELTGIKTVEEMEKPRFYKHHCPYHLVQKNPNAKYLYIYRKPEDTFISYSFFLKNAYGEGYDNLDLRFEKFLSGDVGYGSYFEHVLSYLKHRNEDNLLMISYEKLYFNRKEEILRIAKFLGEEYYQNILRDEDLLKTIIKNTSFEHMKRNLHPSVYKHWKQDISSEGKSKRDVFFRKGIVGDGEQTLSPVQLKRLREVMTKTMKDTRLIEEWLKD